MARAYFLQKRSPKSIGLEKEIAASEKAVTRNPCNELLQKALIDQPVAAREYDKAITPMDHYLEAFPEDGFMRKILDIAKQ